MFSLTVLPSAPSAPRRLPDVTARLNQSVTALPAGLPLQAVSSLLSQTQTLSPSCLPPLPAASTPARPPRRAFQIRVPTALIPP